MIGGLSAVAVVAPLLDLYGKNPEVFVANRTSTAQIIMFGVGVVLLVPLFSWAILAIANAIGGQAPRIAYMVIVGLLAVFSGFVVSRQILPDDTWLALLVAVAVAAVIFWLVRTTDVVFLVAAVALPVLLLMFIGTSATARLVWEEPEAEAVSTNIGSPSNVVMLQLDEMPLASIMDRTGAINTELFPNFARLADEGTWYRNALSDSIATTQSVPAILTGVRGESGQSPSYVDHPENLFTLLGESYDMHVIEWVAELCPKEICPEYAGRAPARFSNLLKDVGVVYGHLTVPGAWREGLPSIDNSWKGFLGQADTPDGVGVEIGGLPVPPDPIREDWVDWVQRLINGIDEGTSPTLSYAHLRTPHVPWVLNPSGTQYQRPEQYTEVEGVEGDGRWGPDADAALMGFQRHLYQIGFLDRMVGRLLDHLEDTGTYDDTMVIVVADHGASFVPGEHRRWPYDENRDDLYRVPLFIKYPDQTAGKTVDLPAFGIDILPTVVEALDIDTDWEFDGESLVDLEADRPHEPMRWCCNGDGVVTDLDRLYAQVDRNYDWIPDQGSWVAVAGAGAEPGLVGSELTGLEVVDDDAFVWSFDLGADLETVDKGSGIVQTFVTGRLEAEEPPASDRVLVVVNDVVAGVAHLTQDSALGGTVSGLLAEELVADGPNDIELLLSDGNGGWLAGRGEEIAFELRTDDGRVLDLVSEGGRRVQVDLVTLTDDGWEITGWGADVGRKVPPDRFYIFAGDSLLFSGAPNVENPNVVRWFDSEDLLESGFEVTLPEADVAEGVGQLVVVAEFGDQAVADRFPLTP